MRARSLAVPLVLGLALSGLPLGGCSTPERDDGVLAGEDNLYQVPKESKEGEERLVIVESFPARSRIAKAREAGENDDVIATWHVHHVRTKDFSGVVMYGADSEKMVRLSFVIGEEATSLVVVEPSEDETHEGALGDIVRAPKAPLSPEMLRWFSEEFARAGKAAGEAAEPSSSNASAVRPQAVNRWVCAARVTTMVLSLASGLVLGPVGGILVTAVEAAAWGDFGGAAVTATLGGAVAGTNAMQKSGSAAVRTAGTALKGLGGVGIVGLVGVALFLAPKETLESLIPPQCK